MIYGNNIRIKSITIIFTLFVVSFFYFLIGYQFSIHEGYFDEGLTIYGAARILNADIPYRDFWTLYAPGEFYLLAALFKLFGMSIIVERIATIVIQALLACSIYLFTKKLTSTGPAFIAWMLTLAWLRVKMPYSCPMTTALLFYILSCLNMASFVAGNNSGPARINPIFTKRTLWLIISGIFAGITTLFRQDIGFSMFIAGSLTILGLSIFDSSLVVKPLSMRIRQGFKLTMVYCLGMSIIVMPAIFYFISKSAFLGLISNAVMFPLKVYPGVRCLPFPKFGLSGGIFYLPILIFFIMIYSLITQANNIDLQKKWLIFFCLFMEIGFFNYTRIRSDIRHLLPTMILTIIFFGFLVFMAIEKKSSRYRRNAYGIIALFSMILLIISVFPKAKLLFLHLNQPGLSLELKRAHGCYDQEKITQDQQEAVEYIQQRTKPDERIFVGNLRHDRIVMNDIMFYFLSERHSVTMYHELHPGLATTEDIQKKIVNEIKQSNIRYVVCWMDDEKIVEENQSCKSSEVMILDDFIRNRYKTEKVLDHYKILRRIEP